MLVKRFMNFALRKGYVDFISGSLQRMELSVVDNMLTENITHEQAQKRLQALDEEPDQVQASILRLLTHSSPQMTQRYAHLHDDALKKVSSVAGNLFSSVRDDAKPIAAGDDSATVKTRKGGSNKKTA